MRTLDETIEAIRRIALLDSAQEVALGPLAERCREPRHVLDELASQGWITAYQAGQLAEGRERELILEPYVLLRPLGRGGMGQVFLAKHRRMKRIVALKVIRTDLLSDPWSIKRFHREIEAVSRLSHPNIVLAHDAGDVDGQHFLVMEYVEGVDLARELAESGPLAIPRAVDLLRQASQGLQHAHEQGLVHRDIKPSNLIVDRRGILKILDLGLARVNPWHTEDDTPQTAPLTPSGVPIGTPDYLAPEQLIDPGRIDIRCDLYSLGCTFYHLLSGRPPFDSGNLFQKFLAHKETEPPALESLRPDVPPGLTAIVRRLMRKRPDERFDAPADVIAALDGRSNTITPPNPPVPLTLTIDAFPRDTPPAPPRSPAGPDVLPSDFSVELVPIDDGSTVPHRRGGLIPLEPFGEAPRDPAVDAALDRGWSLLRWGEARRAVEVFAEALATNPDEPLALLGRGRALVDSGEPVPAIADLSRYIQIRPQDPEGHLRRGLARLAEGVSRRKAIADLSEAIRLDPSNPAAYLHRGLAFARRRDDPPALADYAKAIELAPDLAIAYYYRGLVHARHRRFEEALADYDAAIRHDPANAPARNNRGHALMLLGHYDRAVADYREALRIDPKYAVAHQNLALALADRGEFDEAIGHFGEALLLDSALPIAGSLAKTYVRRGQNHARRGDYPEAIVDYGKALRIDPSLAAAYLGRGIALAKLDDPTRAIEHFTEAIRVDPRMAQAYYNRALLLARRGETARAEADRAEAIRLDPSLGRKK